MLGGMHVRKAIDLYKRGKHLLELVMQKEENDLLTAGVEASKEYVQSLAEIDRTILWGRAGLHKENLRAS